MNGSLSLKLKDLNEHLLCVLCGGYFIDATTIIECLHSFCRSCIVTYLATNKCCPKCEIPAHKTRPLLNVRSDKTLQDVVYKLVPDLFDKEQERKRKFHEETGIPIDAEERKSASACTTPEKTQHRVSLSLEYDNRAMSLADNSLWRKENMSFPKRYLRCYDAANIETINKFIRKKLAFEDIEVVTFCRGEVLPEAYSLMDVANTFSWKLDRPLSLTYMTFTSKGRKRKVLETIENEAEALETLPPKKVAKSGDIIVFKSLDIAPVASSASDGKYDADSIQTAKQVQSRVDARTNPTLSASARPILPRPKLSTVQSRLQHNGNKNMSYSVMNVPLLEAVAAPVAEVSRQVSNKVQVVPRNLTPAMNQTGTSGIPMQGVATQPSQGGERPKSINSIANRLQQQIQMQNDQVVPRNDVHTGVNIPDALKAASQGPSRMVSQNRATWASAKMRRNQIAQHIYASTFQNRDRDEAEETLVLEKIRKGMLAGPSGTANSSPSKPMNTFAPPLGPGQSPRNVQVSHSVELPNYLQAAEQQRKMRIFQQQSRMKYPDVQAKFPVRLDGRQAQNHNSRGQKISPMEDSQLISTTRQLASLRQQQKLLNEIAAAVAGRSTSLRTTESIRAAVSSLSPRMAATRMPSSPRATGPKKMASPVSGISISVSPQQRYSMTSPKESFSPQQRYSMTSPKESPRMITNLNGNAVCSIRPISSSFSEISRFPPNIGYPSLSNPREGSIDIYQNTIAKAKAEVREMSLKDRLSQGHNQIRASATSYGLQRPPMQRKVHLKAPQHVGSSFAKSAARHVPIAPKPMAGMPPFSNISTAQSYPPFLGHSSMSYAVGIPSQAPKPMAGMPPFPDSSTAQTYRPLLGHSSMSCSVGIPPQTINRPMYSCPPTSHEGMPQTRPTTSLPEQDQPLCLVVKK